MFLKKIAVAVEEYLVAAIFRKLLLIFVIIYQYSNLVILKPKLVSFMKFFLIFVAVYLYFPNVCDNSKVFIKEYIYLYFYVLF